MITNLKKIQLFNIHSGKGKKTVSVEGILEVVIQDEENKAFIIYASTSNNRVAEAENMSSTIV